MGKLCCVGLNTTSWVHPGPFGDEVAVSRATIDRWIRAWRSGGFAALAPPARQVMPRTGAQVLELAAGLKRGEPARTAAAARRDHPRVLRRRPVQHRQPQRRPRRHARRPRPGPDRRDPRPAPRLHHRHTRHHPAAVPGNARPDHHQQGQHHRTARTATNSSNNCGEPPASKSALTGDNHCRVVPRGVLQLDVAGQQLTAKCLS